MTVQKITRGHTDLNHGPIGLQPIALPLSYIPSSILCPELQYTLKVYVTDSNLEIVRDI